VLWTCKSGNLTDLEYAELDDNNFSYSIPVTRFDTTLQFNIENSDSPVVEEPFTSLDIHSRTQTYSLGLRQPIYHTVNTEIAISLALLRRENKSFLAGEPFSFSAGSIDGQSTLAAIRFGQEFLTRTQAYAFSVRSTFEFGIDALGATTLPAGLPDSQYWLWLAQAQYVRRLPGDWQLLLRGAAQVTDQPLLPIEQFSLGGIDTVRGYRENQLVRDEALCASAELRIPLIRKNDRSELEVALFCDAGWGKNNRIGDVHTLADEFISSAGVGVLWTPSRDFSMTVYWGYPFKHFDQTADNLQDYGVHFNLIATLP
jgi:hemolysin activation/secretion protein